MGKVKKNSFEFLKNGEVTKKIVQNDFVCIDSHGGWVKISKSKCFKTLKSVTIH